MSSSLLLLSGGLDSSCAAMILKPDAAICIDYGQVSAIAERRASERIANLIGIPLTYISANCSQIGSGQLSNKPALPNSPAPEWWPFRNQLLATIAAAHAVSTGFQELYFGTVSSDRFHADGTVNFFERLDSLLSYQEGALRAMAPLIGYSTVDLLNMSGLQMDCLAWTHSCHVSNVACGRCRGCLKRAACLRESGLVNDELIG